MPSYSYLFAQTPRWFVHRNFIRGKVPAEVQSWVYESNSLTQRLRAHYGSRFGVTILRQGWHKPFINESALLGLPSSHYALVREVLLYADDTPLILARSVIPRATIDIAQRNLSHLGARPLGEIIFAYPDLHRLALEITEVTPLTWTAACKIRFDLQQSIWGRRTIYAIPTETMLVSEFFLPEVLRVS